MNPSGDLKCNRRGCGVASLDSTFVTSCFHLFCSSHAAELQLLKTRICPECRTELPGAHDIRHVQLGSRVEENLLFGLCPDDILATLAHSLHFWQFQMGLECHNQAGIADKHRRKAEGLAQQLTAAQMESSGRLDTLLDETDQTERELQRLEARRQQLLERLARDEDAAGNSQNQSESPAHQPLFDSDWNFNLD